MLISYLLMGLISQDPDAARLHVQSVALAGISAYERGEYSIALQLLSGAVYGSGIDEASIAPLDPIATVYLSRMYLKGEGVSKDGSLSCALFSLAVRQREFRFRDLEARTKLSALRA
jgi:TPR repeat protein